ncbi:MAG: DNA polymerase III subunit delta [Gemmatimonadaceae bacterium]|nr:DNA polymerase III subunit delta [Gemmatimonadaceae bacterium]
MTKTALRDLRAAMQSGRYAAAYYIHGEDEFRKDDLLRSLSQAVVEPATRDFNFDSFRGADANAEQVESLLRTPPMMASRRAVAIRDTGSLKKDTRATLERYLERPSPDSVLVLVALAGTKKEEPFADRAVSVLVEPLEGEALQAWLIEHARAVHGVTLSKPAASALVSNAGADTVLLAAELDKVVSYANGASINERTVDTVVGKRAEASLGELLDHVAVRDLPSALAAVEPVLAQPRSTAVSVIMALTAQTLALQWGVAARERGLAPHRMQGEFMNLLKATGMSPMRPWGDATRAWARGVARWDRVSLARAVRALRAADLGAKDSRLSSDEQLLSTLLCAMCAPAGHGAR